MMSRGRRVVLAAGLAVAWYAIVFVLIYGLGTLLGEEHDIDWLVHLLLFPLGFLSWLVMVATERFGVSNGTELELPRSVVRVLTVVVPLVHFAFITLVAYGVVSWRALRRARGPSVPGRA